MTVVHTPEPEDESAFANADYYSTSKDADLLVHETSTAAIEELVEANTHRGGARGAIIFLGTITVYAYQRKSAEEGDWTRWGSGAANHMAEWFDDEYGFGGSVLRRTGVHEPTLAAELGEVFKQHITDSGKTNPVWQCDRVGELAYSSTEVEALMREENPQWFTEAKP
jgi:hypothetical protein